MDNRMNTIEDSQSTPEHLAGQVGGPGFSQSSDAEMNATPGGLRKSMLDTEHDANAFGGASGQGSQMSRDANQGAQPQTGWAQSQTGGDWRTRLTQRAQSMRSTAGAHPVALGLIAVGVVMGVAAFMRSRSNVR